MSLFELVTHRRAQDAMKDVRRHYPKAIEAIQVLGDRGIITIFEGMNILGKELIETEESMQVPDLISGYQRLLHDRMRLTVVVPQDRAVEMHARILELSDHGTFHQLYYYDVDGSIHLMDRRKCCQKA